MATFRSRTCFVGRAGPVVSAVGDPGAWLAAVPGEPAAPAVIHDGGSCTLAALPGFGGAEVSLAEVAGRVAIIQGVVRWREPDLQALCKKSGLAHALLAGFDRLGESVVDQMAGRFAFAVIDGATETVHLATDRLGQEPLSFQVLGDGSVLFATNLDALSAACPSQPLLRPQSLFNTLFHTCIAAPRTAYDGVVRLMMGQRAAIRKGQATLSSYWTMRYHQSGDPLPSFADAREHLHQHLRASVAAMMEGVADKKVGAFLSGGLDSSTVTGLLTERLEGLKTFTIRFDQPGYDEGEFAQIAVDHFGTVHHEYFVSEQDVIDGFALMGQAYDEPFMNTSAGPAFLCASLARDHGVSVMFAGDGGDELFAGNERYLYMTRFDVYGRLPGLLRRGVLDPVLPKLAATGLPLFIKMNNLRKGYYKSTAERFYHYNPLNEAHSPMRIFNADVAAHVGVRDFVTASEEALAPYEGLDVEWQMMGHDLQRTLADNDLRKVTTMVAAAGLDVRYPFLDDDLLAFSGRLPLSMLLQDRQLRAFYKQAMTGFLPEGILKKSKHGFGLPFMHWARNRKLLKDYLHACIDEAAQYHLFDPEFLNLIRRNLVPEGDQELALLAAEIAILTEWMKVRPDRQILR